VIPCFAVKPRRRGRSNDSEDDNNDRAAFRLCINSDDVDRLLDPALWPDSVVVSEWFYKKPLQTNGGRTTQRHSNAESVNPRAVSADSDYRNPCEDTVIAVSTGDDETTKLMSVIDNHAAAAPAAAADAVAVVEEFTEESIIATVDMSDMEIAVKNGGHN